MAKISNFLIVLSEHIAPLVRTCRGSIYRTRNDGRHKCRPYKDLKMKFLYYLIRTQIFALAQTWLAKHEHKELTCEIL